MVSGKRFRVGVGVCLLFALAGWSQLVTADAPDGFGQLKNPPVLIPGGIDEAGRKYSYLGQAAENQKIILTASNGFFSNGVFRAGGVSKLPKVGDEDLIQPNFEYLEWKKKEGTTRWYLLVKKPGAIRFDVYLETDATGSEIELSFAEQTRTVSTSASNGKEPQAWNTTFHINEPGEYRLELGSKEESAAQVGRLYRIDAYGPALDEAQLLRVRWRPLAVHGRYTTEEVEKPHLLVFTTQSTEPATSYSPITTPFGYYGCTFGSDRRSGTGFNFSMWGASEAKSKLETMPHLLGVGSPQGEFSGFGHEGSGVKPRGWDPMPDRPELVVQALRVENGDEYDTYYGYYYDHHANSWRFFAAGNKWHGGKPKESLALGSFCEVPGPPQIQRSGDVYREVRRRGWVWNDRGQWAPVETYLGGPGRREGDTPMNKRWYTTEKGEYAMGCGGIRLYTHDSESITPATDIRLPYFLSSPTIEKVFELPVQFGRFAATKIEPNRVNLAFEIASDEAIQDGQIYYGTLDALTFAPRTLHGTEKKSELSQAINSKSWQHSVEISNLKSGVNRVSIEGLKPKTTYYYRILIKNQVSRIWSPETLSFTTS